MQAGTVNLGFKSPANKLVRFFHDSRDNWKAKHLKDMAEIKRLKNRIRYLEGSKTEWKQRALDLQAQLEGVGREADTAADSVRGEKKSAARARVTSGPGRAR